MFKANGTKEKYYKVINKIGEDTSKNLKILTKNIMEHEKNMTENSFAASVKEISLSIESAAADLAKSISEQEFNTKTLSLKNKSSQSFLVDVNTQGLDEEIAYLANTLAPEIGSISTSINNVAKAIDSGAKALSSLSNAFLKASRANGHGDPKDTKSEK